MTRPQTTDLPVFPSGKDGHVLRQDIPSKNLLILLPSYHVLLYQEKWRTAMSFAAGVTKSFFSFIFRKCSPNSSRAAASRNIAGLRGFFQPFGCWDLACFLGGDFWRGSWWNQFLDVWMLHQGSQVRKFLKILA